MNRTDDEREREGTQAGRLWTVLSEGGTRLVALGGRARRLTRREVKDIVFKLLVALMVLIVVTPFFLLLARLLSVGLQDLVGSGPGQGWELIATLPGAALRGGVLNAIVGTTVLVLVATAVGVPLSVMGAVYINEYSRPGRVRTAIEFGADVLAGIPSIVFGAFGFTFLVAYLGLGLGALTGGLTLAFMMIPTVMRTTQEALKQVPSSLREASLALGATKWATTWRVTVRAALPGIVTGILLAVGRVMGETAPLIFTTGNNLGLPTGLVGPESWVASLPFTIWSYIMDPRPYLQVRAHSAALVLLMMVLIVDILANYASRRLTRRIV